MLRDEIRYDETLHDEHVWEWELMNARKDGELTETQCRWLDEQYERLLADEDNEFACPECGWIGYCHPRCGDTR